MSEKLVPPIHGHDHPPWGPDPIPGGYGIYAIEVFEVEIPVEAGDKKFDWEIPEDLDEAYLAKVEGYVNTAGSGDVQIQIAKTDNDGAGSSVDLLTSKITIEAGDLNSRTAATQPVVRDDSGSDVSWGDHLRIDVDAAGGAIGLGVILYFVPLYNRGVALEAMQGPPGGVDDWTGQWTTSTSYTTGQSVSHGGSSYVARVDHTSGTTTEPGVGVDWEDAWQLLSEAKSTSAIQVVITGNGSPIDIGLKGFAEVPFDCEIAEVVMLAEQAGSIQVDIWKTNVGTHPPIDANSITGGNEPSIVTDDHSVDTALTGWTTTLLEGDVLAYNVDSNDTITLLNISLRVLR